LLGVPNIDFPLDDIIDCVLDQIDVNKRKQAQDLAKRAADSLATLRRSHDAGTVESALLETTRLLTHFGVSDQAFAKLDLDATRAADDVLAYASFTPDEHLEIEPLCRKLLTSFYQILLRDPDLLVELLPHIHAATLQGIHQIKGQLSGQDYKLDEIIKLVGTELKEIQRAYSLAKGAVANMLRILNEQEVPPEQLHAKLHKLAERHVELTERLHAQPKSNDDPEITKRREQAAEALDAGHYDQADRLLEEAETFGWQAIAEEEKALDRRKLGIAETRFQRGALERTRLNYRKAAEHFAEAANLAPASESLKRLYYLVQQASTLYEQGDEFGDNLALVEAIGIYRDVLDERPRDHVPIGWSMIQNSLGLALKTLGDRETGTERLDEAVNIFQQILQGSTREHRPVLWAGTQVNLGLALAALGERESGTERLEQAVNAYHRALEEYTREHVPHEWATTQNNLGNALAILGERGSGTERLKQAVNAFQAALEEWTRGRVPLDWALTQNNLGNVLIVLSKREEDTERLKEAVGAYRLALEEATRERVPLQWAMTQNSLGNALMALGEGESGTAKLEQAVAAFHATLEEWTRKRVPLQWAGTQYNLGNALRSLGERESSTERLEQAVAAFHAAMEEWTREYVPLDWATVQMNLGNALSILGERDTGIARLEEAVAAYRSALKERPQEHVPLQWAWTQENIGLAYWSIAEKTRDEATLLQGIKAIRVAIDVYQQDQATFSIEKATRNLTGAEALLADLRGSPCQR